MLALLWERPLSSLWPWTTSPSSLLSVRPRSYWYWSAPLCNQRLFQHVTKEFHRFNAVYVTSAPSHPCAIKQISFTSTYWLRYAAAVRPNMAIIKNIRPSVPKCYCSSLHELFSLRWPSECIWIMTLKRPCLFKHNLCLGFFHLLTFQIAATFWLACRLHNKHDRCQVVFFFLFFF